MSGASNAEIKQILDALGIKSVNSGATIGGSNGWLETKGEELVSCSPINGKPIAGVVMAEKKDYDTVIEKARAAFKKFRMMPAPRRGEMVREIGDALRAKKKALGALIALEVGKIRPKARVRSRR